MEFNADKPISTKKDDLLNRSMFSEALAKAILSYTNTENFTIGLCGKWGSGKTSIINLVEEYINKNTSENRPIIIHFNPWNYSDRAQLISQFFASLITELKIKSSKKVLKTIGEALEKYASLFEYTSLIPVVGPYLCGLKTVSEGIGQQIKEHAGDDTLESLKEKVTQALKNQNQKIILIIDDIDRLNNHDIRLIFQLVNSVADFPNMIYLLSFDREIVSRALADEQKCNGQEYLEKIIQVPFDIPEAKSGSIHKTFFDKLDKIWADVDRKLFDADHWNGVFSYCVAPFLKTVRDVNRILNVYQFTYSLMKSETSCIDLLAITILKICAPEIHEWIYNNLQELCGNSAFGVTGIEQNKAEAESINIFSAIYSDGELMLHIVQSLFPKFAWKTGGLYRTAVSDDELRRYHRLASYETAPLYFNLSLDEIRVSREQIKAMAEYYEYNQLMSKLLSMDNNDLTYCLAEMKAFTGIMSPERKHLFIGVLFDLLSFEKYYQSEGLFTVSPSFIADSFLWQIFRSYNQDEALDEIKHQIENSNTRRFNGVSRMLLQIEYSYGRIGESGNSYERIITENQLDESESCWYSRLTTIMQASSHIDFFWFPTIFKLWEKINKPALQEYTKQILEDNLEYVPAFLSAEAGYSSARGGRYYFYEDCINEYIPAEKVFTYVGNLIQSQQIKNLKQPEQNVVMAYYLWYPKRSDQDYKIAETVIEEELGKLGMTDSPS